MLANYQILLASIQLLQITTKIQGLDTEKFYFSLGKVEKFMNTDMLFKSHSGVKSLGNNQVEGYAAVFGNIDSDGDITVKGAFKKTLEENGQRVKHLYQHDMWRPVAKINSLEEDDYGLKYVSTLSNSTLGKDVLMMIEEEILTENSFGYRVIKGEGTDEAYLLKELKLYEISFVTLGANPLSRITGKSLEGLASNSDFLEDRINQYGKTLTRIQDTDLKQELQAELAKLSSHISLVLKESQSSTPGGTKPSVEDAEAIKAIDKFLTRF